MINGTEGMSNNWLIEKYCYDNNSDNCDEYGGLYQWNEMMEYTTTPGVQGICPTGWHLPTINEWTLLVDYLGGMTVAGGKMKETGTVHWRTPNIGATNESGVFQAFRAAGGTTVGFSATLGTAVSGGLLPRTHRPMPGSAYCSMTTAS